MIFGPYLVEKNGSKEKYYGIIQNGYSK